MLGWGAVASILPLVVMAGARYLSGSKSPMRDNLAMGLLMPVLRNLNTLALAVVYMSAIALLFQRDFFRRILSIYAPVGRMAVSNYFSQSAIGLFVFCGVGLGHIGDLRPRWTVVMPIVMFIVRLLCSRLWLKHFRFGPVEWISRSLTYGKMQSIRYPKPATSDATA